jgi:hypothetical protein
MFVHFSPISVWLSCLLLVTSSAVVRADSPSIAFDFGRTAECREVTPDEEAVLFPHEKIVELRLRVSVHLLEGRLDDVEEVRIEIGDCDSLIRVHDFAPSTRLESRHTGDIRRSTTTEHSGKLAASLGGELPVPLGDAVARVAPTINGGITNREVVTETENRVAPQHVVVASGTIGNEHGVFFKLKSSPLSSLEGVHEMTVRFIVPDTWRGDSVRVCCKATGQEKFLWIKQQSTWGHVCAPVALYLSGDLKARQAAHRYAKQKS